MSKEYMNSPDICIACFKKPKKQKGNIKVNGKYPTVKIQLIKHHVRYESELIAFVHVQCHLDIHEGKYPHLIQYNPIQVKEFYGRKK